MFPLILKKNKNTGHSSDLAMHILKSKVSLGAPTNEVGMSPSAPGRKSSHDKAQFLSKGLRILMCASPWENLLTGCQRLRRAN